MGDSQRAIYEQFTRTLSAEQVTVVSIKKVEESVQTAMYETMLRAKEKELEHKKLRCIERTLFHGTSFASVEGIVHCGFNRDQNSDDSLGHGTHFNVSAA